LQNLTFFIRGATPETSSAILEQILANALGVVVRPPGRPIAWQDVLRPTAIRPVGLRDEEALLPYGPRSFQGYRLVREYFAFPERFFFFNIGGLWPTVRPPARPPPRPVLLLAPAPPPLPPP